MMPRSFILVTALIGLSACASTGPAPTPTAQVQQGEIVLSEATAGTDMTGANAAVSIGSAIVGVLVPGPWGSVAGIASGTAGRAAVAGEAGGGGMRYFVKMPDGTMKTVEQDSGAALASGTQVNLIAMSDGSTRVAEAQRKILAASEVTASNAASSTAIPTVAIPNSVAAQ